MAAPEVSIHGRRMLLGPGYIKIDGRRIPGTDIGNKVFYVSSVTGVAGRDGLTPDTAVATIAGAVALCTANQGDTIVLMPKHAETITAAGGIALSKAGISIIGIGFRNQRPTITYTTATSATMTVTAADIYIENILFIGNFASVVTAIDLTATGFTAVNCEVRDTDASHNVFSFIKATGAANTADGLSVINCKRYGLATGGLAFVSIVDNIDRLTLLDNVSISAGTAAPFLLSAGSKIVTGADIGRNKAQMAGTSGNLFISNGGATNTGMLYDCYCANLDVTGAQTFGAATGIQFFNIYATSTSTEMGGIAEAADTPLS